MQNEVFIQSIDIKQVRHLRNIHIPIAENERKHLILTGKNGSGKTSILEELKLYFDAINQSDSFTPAWADYIITLKEDIQQIENTLRQFIFSGDELPDKLRNDINNKQAIIDHYKVSKNIEKLFVNFNIKSYSDANTILAFFPSKRITKFRQPNGIDKIAIKSKYRIEELANQIFLQYLVNLKAQRSFARDDNKMDVVQKIDAWFMMFETSLQEIFDEKTLKLEFDNQNFTFHILQAGKDRFDFNTLSDGYSAILHIVTELMLRMEHKTPQVYGMQGIVLIDEIEAHLHIDLQKKILPFLIRFFPKIQFIVTTHSPFVITSIDNAVVFDLENQVPITNLSHLSVSGVIEGYFQADKYSEHIKDLVTEYETLTQKTILNEEEKDRVHYLRKYFKDLPKFMSNELAIKIQQIELSKLQLA